MSEYKITVNGGNSVRLPTAGKYCDRDIFVAALAGGVELPELENPGSAADLMAGTQLIDGDGKVVDGTFSIASEMSEQDALIEQVKIALQGKASGTLDLTEEMSEQDALIEQIKIALRGKAAGGG